jgi:hypothetical protein
MDPTQLTSILARLSAIEGYLGQLGDFLNSSGPVGGLARAGVNQIGAAVGDPSLLAQVIAITKWIQEAAGTTVSPDPTVLRALGQVTQPKSGSPLAPGPSGPAPIQYPAQPGSDTVLWGVGPGAPVPAQPFTTGHYTPASPYGANPGLAGVRSPYNGLTAAPPNTAAALAALK